MELGGLTGLKLNHLIIPMRTRLYKNGEAISSEYYGYAINFTRFLNMIANSGI